MTVGWVDGHPIKRYQDVSMKVYIFAEALNAESLRHMTSCHQVPEIVKCFRAPLTTMGTRHPASPRSVYLV